MRRDDAATLRQVTRADIAAMHRIRLAVLENRLRDPGRIVEADYVPAIETRGRGWVVETEAGIVGFAIGNTQDGSVWALFVHPEHEGRGHGRRLHDAMVGWFRARGVDRPWLTTEPGTRAEAFYRSLGWNHCGLTAGGELRLELVTSG